MRTLNIILAIAIVPSLVAQSSAQCNRGSRNGPPPSSSPSALATNPLLSSANLAAAQQYRMRLAQQRYLLASQQRLQQQRAQRPDTANPQRRNSIERRNATRSTSQQSSQQIAKRERLRLQNAEKAMRLARTADIKGNATSAAKRYRQVLRILGSKSELGQQATEALTALQEFDQEKLIDAETMLATVGL